MIKRINDFWPTVVVVLVVVLLASWIIYNSNENQKEIIRTVREAQQAKERQSAETLDAIRERIGDEEAWQRLKSSLQDTAKP
jgi:MFS superfamily sulfate permease-like transporter